MKRLKIARLLIENFKGVGRLDLQLDGVNAIVSGQNGTGKTTLADAYTWALTGKMSDGKTAEIGSFDSEGKTSAGENHVVEVTFSDGTTFRRENNGAAKFFVNGVPMKKPDYERNLYAATNGAVSILSMPQNFCALHWQDRRKILMQMANITDAEVIARNQELAPLAELLGRFSPEEVLAISKAQKKKLDAELAAIPARIDELKRQEVKNRSKDEVDAEIAEIKAKVDAQRKRAQELSAEMREMSKPSDKVAKLKDEIAQLKRKSHELKSFLAFEKKQLDQLREDYTTTARAMGGICPTCGAPLPAEHFPALQEKLDNLITRGKELAEKVQIHEQALPAVDAEIEKLTADYFLAEKESAKPTGIETAQENLNLAVAAKEALEQKLLELKFELRTIEADERKAVRLQELLQNQREISAKIAEYEEKIYLVELFNKTKIEMTEVAINSQFEFVRWKMFAEYKVTDGVKECCEPMIGGVPYNGNLSKGERLKAALDILRAVQRLYQIELPVFIDDAESYTSNSIIDLPNQTIRLKAVEGVRRLTVELEQAPIAATA